MLARAALALGGLSELAALVLLLRGATVPFLVFHLLCAALVLAACRRFTTAREWGALGATLVLLFPALGYLGVLFILRTAPSAPGEDGKPSLLQEFSDYVLFKGYWGERRRFGADLAREIEQETAVQPLVDMVTDSSAPVRRAGIRAAGRLGGGVSVQALRTLALSPEPVLRYSAAKELEQLEEKWQAEVIVADGDCRRDAGDPQPCQRSARLYAEGAETALLGKQLSRFLRQRAIEAWREYRRRGGDPATAVPAEARLLILNGRRSEAAELVRAHRTEGEPSPSAELLTAETAAATGNLALLRAQLETLRAGPKTPEVVGLLGFLDEP